MTDKATRIANYLDENLTLDMVNDYRNSHGYDEVYDMDYFNDNMEQYYSYSDVVDMAQDGDFHTYHKYYTCDGSELNSYSNLDDVVAVSDLVDYIIDNEDALGDSFIQDILDESDEERTLIIHNGDEVEELTKEQFSGQYFSDSKFYNREHNCLWTFTGVLAMYDEEDEDMGEDRELWLFDIGKILRDKGKETTVELLGRRGYVIPTDEMTGCMPFFAKFYWFYIPTTGQLMKLIYDSCDGQWDKPKYIEYDNRLGRDVEALEKALEC